MRGNGRALFTTVLLFLMACADHGTMPLVTPAGGTQGTIAFRMLKSQTPAEAWVIEARLEREGFATLKQSVFVRTSPDTITITMSGIAAGDWKVTVDAKDSAGILRYTGTSSVQIIEGQTVQASIQMNTTGGSGNLEVVVTWPSASLHLQVRTAGNIFLAQQTVPVAIINVSGETVNPMTCCARPDLRVQQNINGTWTPPGICELLCPAALLPMKPGQRIVDSAVHITQPGQYRLMLRYWTDAPGESVRTYETYSNEFNVVDGRGDSVKLGEEFVLKIGERALIRNTNLKVEFQDVTEDSRCAEGAICVWAGNARMLLGVNDTTVTLNTTLDPKRAFIGNYVIRLNSLSPYPMVGRRIEKKEYVATMVVTSVIIDEFH